MTDELHDMAMDLPPPRLRDDDGEWVRAGDTIRFSYGIPPVPVLAQVIERDGRLIGLCPGHNPPEFPLRGLRRHVGWWVKTDGGGR